MYASTAVPNILSAIFVRMCCTNWPNQSHWHINLQARVCALSPSDIPLDTPLVCSKRLVIWMNALPKLWIERQRRRQRRCVSPSISILYYSLVEITEKLYHVYRVSHGNMVLYSIGATTLYCRGCELCTGKRAKIKQPIGVVRYACMHQRLCIQIRKL